MILLRHAGPGAVAKVYRISGRLCGLDRQCAPGRGGEGSNGRGRCASSLVRRYYSWLWFALLGWFLISPTRSRPASACTAP